MALTHPYPSLISHDLPDWHQEPVSDRIGPPVGSCAFYKGPVMPGGPPQGAVGYVAELEYQADLEEGRCRGWRGYVSFRERVLHIHAGTVGWFDFSYGYQLCENGGGI